MLMVWFGLGIVLFSELNQKIKLNAHGKERPETLGLLFSDLN